jgi:hypothetical protein
LLISNRWEHCWRAICTAHARRFHDPTAHLHALRELHAQRIIALTRADIRQKTIFRFDLDSPTISDEEFQHELDWAVKRRIMYAEHGRIRKVKGKIAQCQPITNASPTPL